MACGMPPEEKTGEGSSRGVGAGTASKPEGLGEDVGEEEEGGRRAVLKVEGDVRSVDGLADRFGGMGMVGNGGGREGGREGGRGVGNGTDDHGLKRATEGGAESRIAGARAAAGREGANH